ncbi:MAG: acetyl-CoA carboxylase, biotin carboxyl carrier protein [Gammaproteobacteria bacterium]|nr:acetyl-CoA carboxylase, biotin carboxyl carrier protein [Gammaproteobacteria bacterium]
MANADIPKVSAEDIESLIELFKQSGWDEMHLKTADLELFLSNDPNATGPRQTPAIAVAGPAVAGSAAMPTTAAAPASAATIGHAAAIPDGTVAIRAPNLGTFYRAPKPGAPPYVELGQQIEITTEVGLIEVMKLFTPVQGSVRGVVREIRAKDGQMVEFDEPLIIVEPN